MKKKLLTLVFTLVLLIGLVAAMGMNASAAENYLITNSEFAKTENDIIQSVFFRPNSDGTFNIGVNVDIRHVESQYVDRYFVGMGYYYYDNANKLYSGGYGIDTSKRVFDLTNVVKNAKSGEKYKIKIYLSEDYHGDYEWGDYDFTFFEVEVPDFKVGGVEAVGTGIEYDNIKGEYTPVFTTLKSVDIGGVYTGYEVESYGLYKERNGVQLSDQLTTAPVEGETYYTALRLKNPEGNHHIEKNLVNITIPGYTVEFLQAYERDMGFNISVVYSVTKDYQKVSGVEAVARGIEYNSTISGYVPIFTTLKSVGVDGTYTGYEVQVYGLYKTRNGVQLSDQLTTAPVAGETYYTALSLKNPEGNHHIEKNLVNITIPGYTVEFLQAYERDMGFSIKVVYSVTHKTHIGGTATCTDKAKCSVCGEAYGSKLGHSYTNACDTTCNRSGCGATRSITHNYSAATCTKAKTCSVCKATSGKALGHTYKSVTTKATLSKNGKVVTKCSVCGNVSKTTTVYYPKTIKLSKTAYTYNGKVQTPTVTVKDSKGNTLKKDTDYTVKYESGRKSPGKYTVTVTFKGKYTGTKKLYFTIAPKATSKITATQTTTTITLKWNKVTGADGYRVYKYNTKTKKYEKLKDVTKNTLKISKLKAGTAYKYKVRAFTKDDGTIYGSYSDVFETATKCKTPSIKKLTTTKGKASFTWSNVSGESGYQVYYSTKKDSGYKKVASYKTNVVKGSKKKLKSGKKYYFKVRAYKKTDSGTVYSAWSAVKSIKIK